MSVENGTIILVHGAWAEGSCWQNVILPLHRLGLTVVCAPIPLTSLSDDIAALTRALERTSGPVVLVGHAYAGAVIAGPTDERIKALVYIAAFAPGDGETVAQVFYREKPHPEAPHLEPDRHGFIWMPEEGFRNAVAHKASADQKIVSTAVQRADCCEMHSRSDSHTDVEDEADVVLACGRRSHDQSDDAAFHGGTDGRENPLSSGGP
jgi:pimeloyl-ACP methyl ester carboxylesterase